MRLGAKKVRGYGKTRETAAVVSQKLHKNDAQLILRDK